jgi:hypothetical protein
MNTLVLVGKEPHQQCFNQRDLDGEHALEDVDTVSEIRFFILLIFHTPHRHPLTFIGEVAVNGAEFADHFAEPGVLRVVLG